MPKKHILIVDDHIKIAEMIADRLEPHYTVEIIDCGYRAQKRIEEGGLDLIILDCFMPPGPDGADIAKELAEQNSKIHVLLHTYYPEGLSYLESSHLKLINKLDTDNVVQYIKRILPY